MKTAYFDALREVQVRPGVARRVFTGDHATLAFTTLDPGHAPNPHSHPHEQIVYILSGRARFHVGGEEVIVGPGEMLVVPPGAEHWAETVGDESVVDLSIFSPRRDEYAAEEQIGT
jgi:quercetin dioxygenase-like cupin family protein